MALATQSPSNEESDSTKSMGKMKILLSLSVHATESPDTTSCTNLCCSASPSNHEICQPKDTGLLNKTKVTL